MRDEAIVGSEDIARMFSIFHDGSIADAIAKDGYLDLRIEISYLAERIDASFTYFLVELAANNGLFSAEWNTENSESAREIVVHRRFEENGS